MSCEGSMRAIKTSGGIVRSQRLRGPTRSNVAHDDKMMMMMIDDDNDDDYHYY